MSITKENRLEYFNALESYAVDGDLEFFTDMIAQLEEEQLDQYLSLMPEKTFEQGMLTCR